LGYGSFGGEDGARLKMFAAGIGFRSNANPLHQGGGCWGNLLSRLAKISFQRQISRN
jgi:hypothetical protein